jgi:hypothetical protein
MSLTTQIRPIEINTIYIIINESQDVSVSIRNGIFFVTVFFDYNPQEIPRFSIDFNREVSFSDPNFWTAVGPSTIIPSTPEGAVWELTVAVVNGIVTSSGSLDITFTDISNNPIEKFVDIPGHLDTFKLNNGLYADPGVEGIFIQLKKYLYPESIFNIILNSLSEFFTSEGFKQGVTESIEYLNKEFLEGKITIDQFNELVTKSEEELAGQYGDNYMKNYNAVKAAINKYKYLLIN